MEGSHYWKKYGTSRDIGAGPIDRFPCRRFPQGFGTLHSVMTNYKHIDSMACKLCRVANLAI